MFNDLHSFLLDYAGSCVPENADQLVAFCPWLALCYSEKVAGALLCHVLVGIDFVFFLHAIVDVSCTLAEVLLL